MTGSHTKQHEEQLMFETKAAIFALMEAPVHKGLLHPVLISKGMRVGGRLAGGLELYLTCNGLVERIINTNGGFFFMAHGWTESEHLVESGDVPRIIDMYCLDIEEITALRRRLLAR